MDDWLNGRYELETLIGAGGSSTVWSAYDHGMKRRVAVKLLEGQAAADPAARARFEVEAERAGSFSGEASIVTVFDRGEDVRTGAIRPFIVMELLEGGDLSRRLRGRPMDIADVVDLARAVLVGLAEIHRRGLWHGDLKPANVMFDHRGRLRIVDFGISRVVGGGTADEDLAVGTARYVSPEQVEVLAQRQSADDPPVGAGPVQAEQVLDGRSDLYSLGVILFEALTGEPLYHGTTSTDLLRHHLTGTPRDPRGLNPAVPGWLAVMVLRALARRPADRYPDATRMLHQLDNSRSLQDLGAASPPSIPPHLATRSPGGAIGPAGQPYDSPGPSRVSALTPRAIAIPRRAAARLARRVEGGPQAVLDPGLVGVWTSAWLQALREASDRVPGQYWRIPDRLVARIPQESTEPAGGWEVLARTADKQAARCLWQALVGTDSALAIHLPRLTVYLESATGPGLEMVAWFSGDQTRRGPMDRQILTLDIREDQRLALEMRVQIRTDGTWRDWAAAPAHRGTTFGSDPDAGIFYDGPGHHRISPDALVVSATDGPTATVVVGNAAGVTFHDRVDLPLARRVGLSLLRRRVRQGRRLVLSTGDLIYFPGTDGGVRVVFD